MKNLQIRIISIFLFLSAMLSSCGNHPTTYHIGVSQCSDDNWRHQFNSELLHEVYFYDEHIDIDIRNAADDNLHQINDIRYFIDQGVDLLIVAPNEAVPITPVVEEAFNRGIPVIVVDRKISSDKYTAYVGADNYAIGREAGNYVASILGGKGSVVEIAGLSGSTPTLERHEGFKKALSAYPDIDLLTTVHADWQQQSAEEKMEELIDRYQNIDVLFAQNDQMAAGAFRSALRHHRQEEIHFVGIDALSGEGNGVEQVLNGQLDATFINPTGGDTILHIAMNILTGKEFPRETLLSTSVVNEANALVMKMQNSHIETLDHKIQLIGSKMNRVLARYANQEMLLLLSGIIIVLLVGCGINLWITLRKESELKQQKQQLEEQKVIISDLENDFVNRFQLVVEDNMQNPNLNVDELSRQMCMSKVKICRKLKSLTGRSPSEMLCQIRLKHACELLVTTNKTLAEVCLQVGFPSPNHLVKSYEEEYGESFSDFLKRKL